VKEVAKGVYCKETSEGTNPKENSKSVQVPENHVPEGGKGRAQQGEEVKERRRKGRRRGVQVYLSEGVWAETIGKILQKNQPKGERITV